MSVIGLVPGRSLLGVLVLVVAACGSAPASGSVAPSPALSGGQSTPEPAATSPATSSAAGVASSPAARPTATPLPPGTFLVTARNFTFRPLSLEVKAEDPFTIVLKNFDDPGVTHDVDIRKKDGKTVVVNQAPTDGGQTTGYSYLGFRRGHTSSSARSTRS